MIPKIYIEDAAIYYESINRVERLTKPTMFWRVSAESKAEPERHRSRRCFASAAIPSPLLYRYMGKKKAQLLLRYSQSFLILPNNSR